MKISNDFREAFWVFGLGAGLVLFAIKNFATIESFERVEALAEKNRMTNTEILIKTTAIQAKVDYLYEASKKNNSTLFRERPPKPRQLGNGNRLAPFEGMERSGLSFSN